MCVKRFAVLETNGTGLLSINEGHLKNFYYTVNSLATCTSATSAKNREIPPKSKMLLQIAKCDILALTLNIHGWKNVYIISKVLQVLIYILHT